MTKTVTLHDQGIKDIQSEIVKLAARYKKLVKKDPNKAKLIVVFKRGPVTMANGEWSKLPYDKLTLDPNKVVDYFKRGNLNWGILGYGSTKGGLKEMIKFAKTKLNPKQLLGEKQDLKMTINKSALVKRGEDVVGKIIITVPDKSLGGEDIKSPILEKQGYLGINKWKEEASKLLGDNELDSRLKDVLEGKAKLTDITTKFEEPEEEQKEEASNTDDVKSDVEQALTKLKYKKDEINSVLGKLDFSKGSGEAVKQALALFNKN